jgi:hypothetical protein
MTKIEMEFYSTMISTMKQLIKALEKIEKDQKEIIEKLDYIAEVNKSK